VTPNGLYQFQWTETNGQCTDADTVQIAFNAAPVTGMVQASCDGANQNYTISFPVSGGSPPYSVVGGAILNGVFTSNAIPNGQSYLFSIIDANGCSSPSISGVFNCNCATNAGQMNLQLLSACPGNNVTAQASQGANLDADDIGAFILHSNSGIVLGTIFEENTTGIFSFVSGMSYGTTYYISFVVGNNLNGLPDLMDPCLSVTPGQPVIFYANPVVNAGLDVSGCGLTLMTNATVIPGNGLWTVTGTPLGGSASISNAQNAATDVTASVFGVYTLTYTVTDNGCSGTDDVLLSFGDAPTAGLVSTVCDGANLEYVVSFNISDGLAPFTVNSQPVSGTVFTSAPILSGNSYNFVIQDANGCSSTAVAGSFSCNCTTNAGQVSTTPLTVCQSDSITVQVLGGQNLDADDVSAFILHTGSGAALGTVLFQNHTGRFGYWATMDFGTTYYVSVVAGNNLNGFPDPNDMCLSVSPGQPIVFVQNPIPDAGDDFLVCGLTANMPATPGVFSGTWTQVSGPGTITFADIQNPHSGVVASMPGAYVLEWTEVNGLCSTADGIMVNFLELPAIGPITEACNGTNTGYTLNFTINNGAGTINIIGLSGAFSGSSFTSAELPNNSSYSFTVQDAFGCQSLATIGDHFCDCSTFAGTMNSSPLVFCADAMATASWNNDATFDADDAVQYILHDQPGGNMGTVFATNTQPVFSFGPGLQTGTTYYISAIAGNDQAGVIDLNDPCLDVSAGTPVQWKALPFAALLGDATICSGSSTVLNFNGTGAYPLQLLYTDGTGTPVALTIPGPQTIPLSVSPTASTTYTLLSIEDGSLPTCSANLNTSVTVQVNQPVDAGVAAPALERCTGIAPGIALGDLITGEDSGGQWTETSTIPSVFNAFNAFNGAFNTNGQAAGTYTFRYNIQVGLPCPSQSTTVTVILHPTPVADAGEDQLIDCHQDSVTLGGAGTSIGNGIMYRWALAGTEISTMPTFNTGQGGDYSLLATSTFGCSATDTATITVDNDIPFAAIIETNAVKCFGDTNGSIRLDSIVSNHQPVVFSLNGGPFEAVHQYQLLAPGTYVVTLLDNNGCEWNTDSLVVQEPGLVTVDLGGEIDATFGDSVFLNANASLPLAALESLRWTPLFDSLQANTFMQDFLPLISTYVNIELADSNGCKASSRVLVRVQRPRQVYIPNVFKPGSSSLNDLLTVYGGRGVAEIESFRIFDRWGDQLFESLNFQPNDPIIGWDGTHRGDMVLPGVYVYFAVVRFIDGEVELYKGDVTVVR
jgi:hypothetical protein